MGHNGEKRMEFVAGAINPVLLRDLFVSGDPGEELPAPGQHL
jgi:hypothetical protein